MAGSVGLGLKHGRHAQQLIEGAAYALMLAIRQAAVILTTTVVPRKGPVLLTPLLHKHTHTPAAALPCQGIHYLPIFVCAGRA